MEQGGGCAQLYHIADASSHGRMFNGGYDDHHAHFDPDGSLTRAALARLRSQGMSEYVFLKINSHTDQMIARYGELMESRITTVEIGSAGNMMNAVAKSTIASISTSSAAIDSASRLADGKEKRDFIATVKRATETILRTPFAPSTSARCTLGTIEESSKESAVIGETREDGSVACEVYTCALPESLSDLKTPIRLNRTPKIRFFKFDTKELARGGVRSVRLATDVTFENPVNSVLKTHIKNKTCSFDEMRRDNVNDLQTQTMAAFLTKQFSLLPECKKKVSYLKASLVEFKEGGEQCVGQLERLLDLKSAEDFIKWNNNDSFARDAADPEYSATLNALSHWTYEISNHYLVLVDVQGLQESMSFILTDPAIHCTDTSRFGVTNLGSDGIGNFLAAHTCNALCVSLSLPRTNSSRSVVARDTLLTED